MSVPVTSPGKVDIPTAARLTNTSPRYIRRRIADGTLRAYRIAGSRLIRLDVADVDALMQPVGGGER
jgi:excisionase family DNA binding protein